jgi:hypothetical protein
VGAVKTAPDGPTVASAGECVGLFWTPDYLLRHCEGYRVGGPGGNLGFVAEVIETDDSLEFVVESRSGAFRLPADAVECFDPRVQRLTITFALR